MAKDPYQEVTDRICAALERGTVPWRKPWSVDAGYPRSIVGRPYTGINQILLGMSEFADPRWATFKAAKDHGGSVRKGEHGTFAVLFKPLEIADDKAPNGKRTVPMFKYYYLFNVEQIDGLSLEPINRPVNDCPPIERADSVWDGYSDRPSLAHGGSRAFYRPSTDAIQMPDMSAFDSSEAYYGTLWHEAVHSTGHSSRLARADLLDANKFGDACYSREELTAEMGSAMISARIGIDTDIEQSAAYIRGWLRALRDDRKLVISAASRAQKATDRIMGAIEQPA